jgi:hypothetical protein
MMKRWIFAGAAALALAGCVQPDRAPVASSAVAETITYETGPCHGFCPVFKLVVSSDGAGTFTGIQHTAVTGDRPITLTASEYAAFAGALAPYRPTSGEALYQPGTPLCDRVATDMPSVDVRWRGDSEQHLYYYYGCDREKYRAMADGLRQATDALPLAALIGKRP